jgi:hypothetical protein
VEHGGVHPVEPQWAVYHASRDITDEAFSQDELLILQPEFYLAAEVAGILHVGAEIAEKLDEGMGVRLDTGHFLGHFRGDHHCRPFPLILHRVGPLPGALGVEGARDDLVIHPDHVFQGHTKAISVALAYFLVAFKAGHDDALFKLGADIFAVFRLRHVSPLSLFSLSITTKSSLQ